MGQSMRTRLYAFVFRRYRRAPFDSRRANLWWWLSCRIEHTPSGRIERTPEGYRTTSIDPTLRRRKDG